MYRLEFILSSLLLSGFGDQKYEIKLITSIIVYSGTWRNSCCSFAKKYEYEFAVF
jgi:hypothetical protein